MALRDSPEFNALPPALEQDIAAAEAALGRALPADYRSFLLEQDGGEGWVGAHYLSLWRTAELVPFNAEYEVPQWAPGFIIFGSNGGGEGFGFDTRSTPWPVVQVPFIGMSHEDGRWVASGFSEFLRRMRAEPGSLF
jgi:cell wall assembly regulator SMI1